jgi:hypothetical protein
MPAVGVNKNEFFLDENTATYVWNTYHAEPFVRVCRNIITRHLFSDGLEIKKGDKVLKVTPEFQQLIDEYWIPFATDAMDCILCFGFLPVRITELPTGDRIPIVMPWNTYRISIELNKKFLYQYRVYDRRSTDVRASTGAMNKPDPHVVVMDDFGARPTHTGELTTSLASMLPSLFFKMQLFDAELAAENLRTKPLYVVQSKDHVNTPDEEKDTDVYADTDWIHDRQQDKYMRTQLQANQFEFQQQCYQQYYQTMSMSQNQASRLATTAASAARRMKTEDDKPWENIMPLPVDQQLANHQMPQIRPDLVDLAKLVQEEICIVMGVPRSTFLSDYSQAVKGNNEALNRMFRSTLLWWRKILTRVLTRVYDIIYGESDGNYWFYQQMHSNKRRRKDPLSADELYAATVENKVQVTFPSNPVAEIEQLTFLNTRGIIDWNTYTHYMLRAVCIPEDEAVNNDILKPTDKKQMLNAAENKTEQKSSKPQTKKT